VLEGENTLGYLLARLRSHVTDGRRPNIEELPIAGMTVLGLPPLSVDPAPEKDESKQIGLFE